LERRLLVKGAILAFEEEGRLVFEKQDLLAQGFEESSLQKALWRLQRDKRLVSPARNLFVIVPTVYRSVGTPPPTWYLDAWMKHRCSPDYYVSLLSAAALHGASHHAIMETQVMLPVPVPLKIVASARFRFFVKSHISATPCMERAVETGTVRVSSPVATFLDLISYSKSIGSIGTALLELAENLTQKDLTACLRNMKTPIADIQRAGFYLEKFSRQDLADVVADSLKGKELHKVMLVSSRPPAEAQAHAIWKVIPNVTLEVDV
jgi:AbiEi antitoxin C-terminal domain